MKSALLIVTAQASFGVLVRDGLDPTRFDVFSAADLLEAEYYVRQYGCFMVLMDVESEEQEQAVLEIGSALRKISAELKMVVMCGAGQAVKFAELAPVTTISKSTSLPDLSRLIERLSVSDSPKVIVDDKMPEYDNSERKTDEIQSQLWLTDVSRAAQQLTQLTLESAAQAAFITRQNELWAYAGQLSREAAQELTGSIQRYWSTEGESDLLRFVRLRATEAQHMLYVRKLSHDMNLALVFDAETPFSTIRSQAGRLVKNMFDNPAAENMAARNPETNLNAAPLDLSHLEQGLFPASSTFSELLGNIPLPNPARNTLNTGLPREGTASFPERTPNAQPPAYGGQGGITPGGQFPSNPDAGRISFPYQQPADPRRGQPGMDEPFNTPYAAADGQQPRDQVDMGMTRKQNIPYDTDAFSTGRYQPVDEPSDGGHRIIVESPSVTHVNVSYACLLIPRLENHHLVGDAATRLNEWVPQLCVAFGWRLEYISVRPDYLQWIARVPLNTAAGYVISMIRKHTSERFFNEFPRFKAENPSGEFWAHGFIVQGGSQPHPQKLIQDFIWQTRMRQGLR